LVNIYLRTEIVATIVHTLDKKTDQSINKIRKETPKH